MTEQWHPGDDLLLEVALGHAADGERDRVGTHLAGCPECRREHDDLLTGIDLTLPAVPRTAPPPGFETTVLTTLSGDGTSARPRRAVGRWLAVAAAGLVGIAIGLGGAQVADDARDDPTVASAAVPFVTDDGSVVGSVSAGHGVDGGQLAVVVSAPGGTVTCRAVLADGTVRDLAQWRLSGDDDVWLVDEPAPGVRKVELVDEDGEVWATAEP